MIEYTLSKYLVKRIYAILLSIGAVIGVACLIVILSLFHNYYLSSEKVFMGIHPHIEIHKNMTEDKSHDIINLLKKECPEIINIQPALYMKVETEISKVDRTKAFCVKEKESMTCYSDSDDSKKLHTRYGFHIIEKQSVNFLLKGIRVHKNQAVMDFKRLINGSSDLQRLEQTQDTNHKAVLKAFYMEQGVFNCVSGYFLMQFKGFSPFRQQYRLNGTINMGTKKGNNPLLIMSLANAQNAIEKKNFINTFEISIQSPYHADKIAQKLSTILDSSYNINTWIQKEKASFTFLTIIKWMIFSIIFSISIVAAISIFSTLYLTVLENRKKIAILKALGMKDASIYIIFLMKTFSIGLLGTFFGCILGYAGSYSLIHLFRDSLEKLGLEDPQPLITASDISVVAICTIFLFLLTAIVPARNAVKIDPIQGLNQ